MTLLDLFTRRNRRRRRHQKRRDESLSKQKNGRRQSQTTTEEEDVNVEMNDAEFDDDSGLDAYEEDDRDDDAVISLRTTSVTTTSTRSSSRRLLPNRLASQRHFRSHLSASAVRRTQRGSGDWHSLIRPFVADLVMSSVLPRRCDGRPYSFQPYQCQAALLFVDISGYSKIMATFTAAHALSSVVNAYLERLLKIIQYYGGDVVKFAGDAVLVVWQGELGDDDELEYNVLAASSCAVALQEQAGSHPVPGTNMAFAIHCAVCCGVLESEIFVAPSHVHMQKLYHSLSGQCMIDISTLIDLAKAGEIAVTEEVMDHLGVRGTYDEIDDIVGASLLSNLQVDRSLREAMEQHIEDVMAERYDRRIPGIEEDFIHPCVLALLETGGQSPTSIAQMRNLCVLFIAMTSNGNSVNWLLEVQSICDHYRCPIVQILDDDKGTHVAAAVNLFESVPESSILGLDVCRALVEKELGCAIGVAMGSTFCGVTGSSSIACRWDITGAPPVRAARLMQFALHNKLEVAIDASLFEDPVAATRMALLEPAVPIKGSAKPCPVYRLSGSKLHAVFRVLEYTIPENSCIAAKAVQQVRKSINSSRSRCCVIVTGVPFSGKKLVCQRAAASSNFVPYSHVCDERAGLAQLARSIATWFSHVEEKRIRSQAAIVLGHMDMKRWSRAHDDCVQLINEAVNSGLRACFVLERVHFLDSFSLSILRECLQGTTTAQRESRQGSVYRRSTSSSSTLEGESTSECSSSNPCKSATGKVVFLGSHMSLYNQKSAERIVQDITRANTFRVKIVEVKQAAHLDARDLIREVVDLEPEKRWLRCHTEASGDSLDYFLHRAKSLRSGRVGDGDFEILTRRLTLDIPLGYIQKNQQVPVTQISAEITMKFFQLYDELPHMYQILIKVLAVCTRRALLKGPRRVIWEVMNDLVSEGIDKSRFSIVCSELQDMSLLDIVKDGGVEKLVFQNPGLADVALDVCTPAQISAISSALVFRLEPLLSHNFKVPLTVALLRHQLGHDRAEVSALLKRSYASFLRESDEMSTFDEAWWRERIVGVIGAAGEDPYLLLGTGYCSLKLCEPQAPASIRALGSFAAPITFGPMSHSLSVICRSLFQEYGAWIREEEVTVTRLQEASASACRRLQSQLDILEDFLQQHEIVQDVDYRETERKLIDDLSQPSTTEDEVRQKAAQFLNDLVRPMIQQRLPQVRLLVDTLKLSRDVPSCFVECRDGALLAAYDKLKPSQCWKDSTEDALMVLAMRRWKPRRVPEDLPHFHYQTVCRVRDEVLRQLGTTLPQEEEDDDNQENSSVLFRHSFEDFEAFLVTTALFYQAEDAGRC